MTEMRLQKFLARAGVASRRHAEELIAVGRVTVNGARVTEMGGSFNAASSCPASACLYDSAAWGFFIA